MDAQIVVAPETAIEEVAIPEREGQLPIPAVAQCPPMVVAYLGDRWRRSRYSVFTGIQNGLKRAETKPFRETVRSQKEKVETFIDQRNAKILEWIKDGKDTRNELKPILKELDKAQKALVKAQDTVSAKAKPFQEKVKDHNASIRMIDGREKGALEGIMGEPCASLESVTEEDKQALEASKKAKSKKSEL